MTNIKKVEWLLRIGVAGEFIGHGLLAYSGKSDWVKWITLMLHMSTANATSLLMIIGVSDILVALVVLTKPIKSILQWAAFWGFWTALVRPIVMYLGATGVGWLDFVERTANWAAPLALYYFYRSKK